tara:strand:+ start:430 stop:4542 length:4113 start_codon:yes stop_codon:yes gene_type:complete
VAKQEFKILEFHGGSNNKFDPRDIADNQNVLSRLSTRSPGRLITEGNGKSLYDKTNLNGHTTSDITASSGGYEQGYGLHAFSHDYNLGRTDIIQNGTDFASNWADRDAGGNDDGWDINSGSSGLAAFQYSDAEDASLINTLGGGAIDADVTYQLWFDVGAASLNLAIGGANQATGSSPDETYISAADYDIGTHMVEFTAPTDRSHLWFTADQSACAGAGTIDNVYCFKAFQEADDAFNDLIILNDAADIDIYDLDTTTWHSSKFSLGSRTATVKPNYYNVDGGLRVCDSNFDVQNTNYTLNGAILKDQAKLVTTSGTIAKGSIIQIDQEVMYVTTGSSSGTSIVVIRGFANTKATTHSDNSIIYYANVPKYFGHIKKDRLFECSNSTSVNEWTEDIQTPQPPNNMRKGYPSYLTSPTNVSWTEQSKGKPSLTVVNEINYGTDGTPSSGWHPREGEKVALEFASGGLSVGITRIECPGTGIPITNPRVYTSSAHGFTEGDEIVISGMVDLSGDNENMSTYNNTWTVSSVETSTTFRIDNDDAIFYIDEHDATAEQYYADITGSWVDLEEASTSIPGAIEVTLGEDDMPFLNSSDDDYDKWADTAYIEITGQTGLPEINGIYEGKRSSADNSKVYFYHGSHDKVGNISGTTQVRQLLGKASSVADQELIPPDLKRKWNFAMSFTYDGPGQEVQESLMTMGHKLEVKTNSSNNTTNLVDNGSGIADDGTTIAVDRGDDFSAGDIIQIDVAGDSANYDSYYHEYHEQLRVDSKNSNDLRVGVGGTNTKGRGYNGTTALAITDNSKIYKVQELSRDVTVDWTGERTIPECVIKFRYKNGNNHGTWNPRINGFKIYMKDVTNESSSPDWLLFSSVNFDKGTYQIFADTEDERILAQSSDYSSTGKCSTIKTELKGKPIYTYITENRFSPETIIDAKFNVSALAGRRVYIGNIRQGGRSYPDRMIKSPINRFDIFPETNFLDVAVGDGDEITALESFGDRLLQFKKDKLYILNISGEFDVIESEHPNTGVNKPHQVVKTSNGIAWINDIGLWFFDGKGVECLTRHLQSDGFTIGATSLIGYDERSNRLIFSPEIKSSGNSIWLLYDLELNAYQSYFWGNLFPTVTSDAGGQYYSNFINIHRNMVFAYVTATDNTEVNFYKWSNDSDGEGDPTLSTDTYPLWKSKDFDFGSPSVDKKIYKIYVTYKTTGHSGVKMLYGTNGSGTTSSTFSNSTYYDTAAGKGFLNTSGEWQVAELKPSASINNIKSIQLVLSSNPVGTSSPGATTCVSGGTTTARLHGDLESTDYSNYILSIYDGPARYNVRRITSYNTSNQTATVSTFTERGYGNSITSSSKYILGAVSPDFEINDITIIFRPKRVK